MERDEHSVTTLRSEKDEQGGGYVARIENGVVTLEVRNIETYASIRVPCAALDGLAAFLDAVRADESTAVRESSEPVEEPVQEQTEEATNG